MSVPSLKTEHGTLFDYDLNVYQFSDAIGVDDDGETIYSDGPWYIDVYQVNEYQGATSHDHVAGPFELTPLEANMLELGKPGTYFSDDDCWYGMWGFLEDYKDSIHPRVLSLLNTLPKYTEEVLF